MQNIIFHATPRTYGLGYLSLIPIFALLFYIVPDSIGSGRSFIECVYFSTVTITTLGYGDITPSSDLGRMIASSESIFGVMLIGLFLNSLSRVRSETTRIDELKKTQETYKNTQLSKLNGCFNLLLPLIGKHQLSVIEITSPLSDRKKSYNSDFTLNDMMDLYGPTMLMTQSHHEPAVKYYFESLDKLSSELTDLIKTVDLRLFPKLEEYCLSFVNGVHSFDFSNYILSAVNVTVGGKKMTDKVKEMLEKHEGKVEFLESNIINGYIALFHQIKLHMGLIDLIKTEFTKIKD